MTKKNLFSAALWMTGLSAFSKVLGLIRESTLAAHFGANDVTDAYKIAFSLPNIFFAVIAAAISQTFIPVYADYLKEGDEEKNNRFLSNLINWLVVCSLILLILLYIGLPWIIRFIAPGFNQDNSNLTVELATIMLPAAVFFILSNLASAYLQSHHRFITPALVWYPHNFFIIGSILIGGSYGIKGVAWGSLLAFGSMLLIQIPSVLNAGFKYQFYFDIYDSGARQIVKLSCPVLVGVAFTQIYVVVYRILASNLSEGSITALDYANKVNSLALNIFVATIATIIYPKLSQLVKFPQEFTQTVSKALKIMMIISLPITMSLLILREPIIELLFERGSFSKESTILTANALAGFSVGIIGIAFREILNRAFYALKDTKTPMVNGIVAILLQITLCIVLVKPLNIGGLALGTSIAGLMSGAMLYFRLNRTLKATNNCIKLNGGLKIACSAILFVLVLWGLNSLLIIMFYGLHGLIYLSAHILVCVMFAGAAYISALRILHVKEVLEVTSYISDKIRYSRKAI